MRAAHPYLRSVSLKRHLIWSYEPFPFCLPAVRELQGLDFHAEVTIIAGEYGCGKSTLLEAIASAWGLGPNGSVAGLSPRTAESSLYYYLQMATSNEQPAEGFFLRTDTLERDGLSIDAYDPDEHAIRVPGLGESAVSRLINGFSGQGLYLLDEPETMLSPVQQLAALRRIRQLARAASQFIIATHSPILLAFPGARVYWLDEDGYARVRYEDTEPYAVMKEFLENPRGVLEQLFADER
jgi:predicted ATPase